MGKPARDSGVSAEERRPELRRLAKEIESALADARFRKSVHAFRLLEEGPALYGLERDWLRRLPISRGSVFTDCKRLSMIFSPRRGGVRRGPQE